MGRTPAKFATGAEFALLEETWRNDVRTVRDLVDALYPGHTASEVATVQKLLTRLEEKGLVERDRATSPHRVTATFPQKELAKRELQAVVDKCGLDLAELAKL